MFDPLNAYDLVADEIEQRRVTGHDVTHAAARLATLAADDEAGLRSAYAEVLTLEADPAWSYDEPSDIRGILALLPDPRPWTSKVLDVEDGIHAGWLGRIAGCNVGKPVEGGTGVHWPTDRIREYLELAGAYPLLDYIPALDPMPPGFVFKANWPETTRGNVRGSARDDDIDYAILGLQLVERHGADLQTEDVASAWLTYLPFMQVFTAERAVYRNLIRGIPARSAATVDNPYREWIGALIRADIFGWVYPGRPRAAAILAHRDASLSHVANGIYGEMWAAALIACAFVAANARDAVECSLDHVPPRSRLAEAVRDVLDMHVAGKTWDAALAAIQVRYGQYGWVHAVNNAAIITAGLLWGDGDPARTIGLTVMGGWDTDSNGATAGSVVGILGGTARLPSHLIDPLEDRTRSALFGSDHSRISKLAERTIAIATSDLPDPALS
jgi:ADP-ribosylglycohydrolase